MVLDEFKRNDIGVVFHYVPLHSSPAGERYGRVHGSLEVADHQSKRLVRLPLWYGLSEGAGLLMRSRRRVEFGASFTLALSQRERGFCWSNRQSTWLFILVPKLQLGNPPREAPASTPKD